MIDTIQSIIDGTTALMHTGGPIFGFLLIIIESIFPILPLGLFVALNNIAFGSILGFGISWVATIIGCLISFYAFRLGFSKVLYKKVKVDGKIHKFMNRLSKISLPNLVLLVALPFTPAFLVNISAGLSKVPAKRFIISIIIGKMSIVYFWGYIGKGFIDSLKDPFILVQIAIMMALTYIMSVLIQKFLKMNEVK